MRLLNTTTLSLQVFDRKVPAYCTASLIDRTTPRALGHDVSATALTTRGYAVDTLAGLCRYAKGLDFEWLWLGTCCVDWNSKSERDEAYSLLSRWIANSEACIAYLDDVAIAGNVRRGYEFAQSERCAFFQSEWFALGWMLQPLVAAKEVVFVDANFNFIGTRSKMAGDISYITGIDVSYLDGTKDFSEASVATRMFWAAARNFKEPEDEAYCLIGLMQIEMSADYGEGRMSAFYRLQRKILASSNDQSIFAWISSNYEEREPFGMLAESVRDFKNSRHVMSTPDVTSTTLSPRYTKLGVRFSRCLGSRGRHNFGPDRALLTLRCNLARPQGRHEPRAIAIAVRRFGSNWYRVNCGDWLFSKGPEMTGGYVETFYIAQPGYSISFTGVEEDIKAQAEYEHRKLQEDIRRARQKRERTKVMKTAVAIAVPLIGALAFRGLR